MEPVSALAIRFSARLDRTCLPGLRKNEPVMLTVDRWKADLL